MRPWRRHTRGAPIVREVRFDRDALGRVIVAKPGMRYCAGVIEVSLDHDESVKTYRARSAEPERPPVLPPRLRPAA